MKITRKQLRKIILTETRAVHVQGIRNKIARLEAELERQEGAYRQVQTDADYMDSQFAGEGMSVMSMQGDPMLPNINGIRERLENLYAQLNAFSNAGDGPVGELPRFT